MRSLYRRDLGAESSAVGRLAGKLGIDVGGDVGRHLLDALHDLRALAGDALLGLVDARAELLAELGQALAGGSAVGLGPLALQATGVLTRVGQPLLVGRDQRPRLLARLLGRVQVALDLGLPLLQRVADRGNREL